MLRAFVSRRTTTTNFDLFHVIYFSFVSLSIFDARNIHIVRCMCVSPWMHAGAAYFNFLYATLKKRREQTNNLIKFSEEKQSLFKKWSKEKKSRTMRRRIFFLSPLSHDVYFVQSLFLNASYCSLSFRSLKKSWTVIFLELETGTKTFAPKIGCASGRSCLQTLTMGFVVDYRATAHITTNRYSFR